MAIFELDILPQRTAPTLRRPEHHLLRALLEDALCLALGGKGTAAAMEARAWLADDSEEHPFTFVSVCHQLGQNPGHLRRLLARHDGGVRPKFAVKRY